MSHRHSLALLALMLPLLLSAAQDPCDAPSKDPIEVAEEKAIEKDSSTVGMRMASNAAREKWDAEMNAVYKRLMARLSQDQKTALQQAQRAWLAFRDAEGKSITAVVAAQDGTMYPLIATGMGAALVKQRVLQLREFECLLEGVSVQE